MLCVSSTCPASSWSRYEKEPCRTPGRPATRLAAGAGDSVVGQPPLDGKHLLARLVADDRLELAHHERVRVRPDGAAQQVVRRRDVAHPVADRFVDRILER